MSESRGGTGSLALFLPLSFPSELRLAGAPSCSFPGVGGLVGAWNSAVTHTHHARTHTHTRTHTHAHTHTHTQRHTHTHTHAHTRVNLVTLIYCSIFVTLKLSLFLCYYKLHIYRERHIFLSPYIQLDIKSRY